MRQLPLLTAILLLALTACVPRDQYQALETERNYYRNQVALADSLEDQRAIQSYDQVAPSGLDEAQRIRQVEALTATNKALNDSYQDLKSRYEQLLSQSQTLLNESGDQVTGLQQSLAERTAQLTQREDELRQLEADLVAREDAIRRIESDYAPAGGGEPASYGGSAAPTAYGTSAPVAALNARQSTALKVNEIQTKLSQVLTAYPVSSYQLLGEGTNRLRVVLNESLLTDDGFTVSPNGQSLLRSLAGSLRNQPAADLLVVGHADNSGGNALRAYEDSTDKAINVAQQLINYGLSPQKVTVAGKGFYDPVSNGITARDLEANRRTELVVTVREY